MNRVKAHVRDDRRLTPQVYGAVMSDLLAVCILSVACPYCGAEPGRPCKTSRGHASGYTHTSRVKAGRGPYDVVHDRLLRTCCEHCGRLAGFLPHGCSGAKKSVEKRLERLERVVFEKEVQDG